MSRPEASAAAISVTTYSHRWKSVISGKRLLKAMVSKNAKRICVPVCATRSSWSSSR